jgi:hypothetical protein
VLIATALTVVVLLTLPAPASALTVTLPTVPAPLPPVQLPLGGSTLSGSVSGGAGGAPIDITVNGPASTGIEVQLPGIPSAPALPIAPTGPVTEPIATAPVPTPTRSSPQPASPSHPGGAVSSGPVPAPVPAADHAAPPVSPFAAGPARPLAAPLPAPAARVSAVIDARPADSLLHRVQAIAGRLVLWALLAAVLFVLEMLVASTLRRRRPQPAGLS